VTGHVLTAYYISSALASLVGTVLLIVASRRAVMPLRPWFAAAVPAALGYLVVNVARLIVEDDASLTDVARGLTLYGLFVLYNALPYAAIHHATHAPGVVIEEFVGEVVRQLNEED
jgi:hypothetical protein